MKSAIFLMLVAAVFSGCVKTHDFEPNITTKVLSVGSSEVSFEVMIDYPGDEPIEVRGVAVGRSPEVTLVPNEDDGGVLTFQVYTNKGKDNPFMIDAYGLITEPNDYYGNPYPDDLHYAKPFAISRGKVVYGEPVSFELISQVIQ